MNFYTLGMYKLFFNNSSFTTPFHSSFFYTFRHYFSQILTLSGVIVGSGIISIFIVGNLYPHMLKKYYNSNNKNTFVNNGSNIKNNKIKKYISQYFDELENLEDIEYDNTALKQKFFKDAIENTPVGKVIMSYNIDYECYWYFSDNKNINYKILDTVARKYAIDNNCKSICVNFKKEYNKIKNKNIICDSSYNQLDDNLQISSDKNLNKKSIYLKPKNYNIPNYRNNNNKDNTKLSIEKTNRFTYKGNINDYYYKPAKKSDIDISYKKFKNQ